MKTTILFICMTVCTAMAHSEHYMGFGLFTEHFIDDSPNYNEDNELVYYQYLNGKNTAQVGTFVNSHFVRSYSISAGREYDLFWGSKFGVSAALIHGYKGFVKSNCGDFVCIPIVYVKTGIFTHTVLVTAYNLSVTVEF